MQFLNESKKSIIKRTIKVLLKDHIMRQHSPLASYLYGNTDRLPLDFPVLNGGDKKLRQIYQGGLIRDALHDATRSPNETEWECDHQTRIQAIKDASFICPKCLKGTLKIPNDSSGGWSYSMRLGGVARYLQCLFCGNNVRDDKARAYACTNRFCEILDKVETVYPGLLTQEQIENAKNEANRLREVSGLWDWDDD